MPCDFITVNRIACELDSCLSGGRIEKVFQPSKDELTFTVRANGKNLVLYLSASPRMPILHLTGAKLTNPELAPAFCMHVRKHLTHAIIDKIQTFNNDRIVKIDLTGRDELNFSVAYALYFEMTGRYTNVILTRDGVITEALRHSAIGEAERTVLPGIKYECPESKNTAVTDLNYVKRVLLSAEEGSLSDALLKQTSGLARSTADYVTMGLTAPVDENGADLIVSRLRALLDGEDYSPCVKETGEKADFFVTPYGEDYTPYPDLSSAIEFCTVKKRAEERRASRARRIITVVKNAVARNEKKLALNQNKLLDGQNADRERIKAELITANIYRIKRGDTVLRCEDYYTGKEVEIPLDPTLSPQQNAQRLFARYAKLKRSVEKAEEQIAEITASNEYLATISNSVSLAESETDFSEIETELMLAGYLSDKRASSKKGDTLSRPIEYRFEGIAVMVGKNNLQNDRLTFKSAINSDLWFHVKGFHGSHVVARIGKEPSPALLHFCAELAAYYSGASTSPKVEVDYTRIKNVKRHPSGRPGLVTYVDYKTLTVTPLPHEDFIKKI